MSRPIGKQVRALMQASDSINRAPVQGIELARIAKLDITASCATRLCRRAQDYGLAKCINETPLKFHSLDGWDNIKPDRAMAATGIKHRKPQGLPARIINSVFALGTA